MASSTDKGAEQLRLSFALCWHHLYYKSLCKCTHTVILTHAHTHTPLPRRCSANNKRPWRGEAANIFCCLRAAHDTQPESPGELSYMLNSVMHCELFYAWRPSVTWWAVMHGEHRHVWWTSVTWWALSCMVNFFMHGGPQSPGELSCMVSTVMYDEPQSPGELCHALWTISCTLSMRVSCSNAYFHECIMYR